MIFMFPFSSLISSIYSGHYSKHYQCQANIIPSVTLFRRPHLVSMLIPSLLPLLLAHVSCSQPSTSKLLAGEHLDGYRQASADLA